MTVDPCHIEVRLVRQPVAAAEIASFPPDAGAECVFLGRTRSEWHPQHGDLVRLEYDAHEQLAHRVLEQLAEQAAVTHGCRFIRLIHATGPVAVGEASVLIQVACGHRSQAFAACRWLIDSLKQRAPIWKQEIWTDGTSWSEGTVIDSATTSTPTARRMQR